jgi:NADPH-dependent 2,4-dienoyl-CoA reductase/sulfur reductase-like enzyme
MSSLVRFTRPALRLGCAHGLKLQSIHRAFSISQARLVDPNLSSNPTSSIYQSPTAKKRTIADRMRLNGKTTVITGGARGIGLALAEAAAEAGSDVAILDVLDQPERDLLQLGVRAKYYRCIALLPYLHAYEANVS